MSAPQPLKSEKIWYTRCPVPTPAGIAIQKGWISDRLAGCGLTVDSIRDSSDRAVRSSHFDHTLERSFRQGGNIPALWARSAGRDTRLIGLTWTDEYQALIALPSSGIRTVKDLAGRRIALPKRLNDPIDFTRAQALRGILGVLEAEGVDTATVQLRDLPIGRSFVDGEAPLAGGRGPQPGRNARRDGFQAELFALVRGEVDAIFVKGSHGAELANQIGALVVADIGNHPDPLVRANNATPRTLTVDGQLLRSRPDAVTTVVRAILDAGRWARENPRETAAYIARETGSTEDWVRFAYGEDLGAHLGTDLSAANLAALAHFKDFLVKHGFLPADFDVHAWADHGPLAAAHGAEE
jgi:ABC-type nitrate/sulfonate/bicarbonate transport system substrate-binding protein